MADTDVDADRRYAEQLGERLRRVRQQQELSLQDVEARSAGDLKASVVGAYERGERAVSITRLQRLATFYRVPVGELLPDRPSGPPAAAGDHLQLVIDLVALEARPEVEPTLVRYVRAIQARRGDYAGRVLSVRGSDLEMLAAIVDVPPADLQRRLAAEGLVH